MNEVPSPPPLGPSVQGRFLDEGRVRRSASNDDSTPHDLASDLDDDLAAAPRLVFLVLATLCMLLVSSSRADTVVVPNGGFLASTGAINEGFVLLNDDRFAVEVSWRNFEEVTGIGTLAVGSEDTAVFWFFNANNWELMIKVIDGCGFNDRFWVFASASTNVEYTLRVTDTQTGAVKTYLNPLGNASVAITDTTAFATCSSPGLGEFDPSNVDDGDQIWRVKSNVVPSQYGGGVVSTALERSTDGGKTWTEITTLNRGQDQGDQRVLNYETASLMYDPNESDTNKRWKLVTFVYQKEKNEKILSTIRLELREAGSSVDLGDQRSDVLLAGTIYRPDHEHSAGKPMFDLPATSADCLGIAEPALLSHPKGGEESYWLAYACIDKDLVSRIDAVKMETGGSQDTLVGVGSLLTSKDPEKFAEAYGSKHAEWAETVGFSAPDLVSDDQGQVYLIVSPITETSRYMGCVVFRITDYETATIERDSDGTPKIYKEIFGQGGTFRGACTWSPNSTQAGIVLSQLVGPPAPFFSLVNTGVQLP